VTVIRIQIGVFTRRLHEVKVTAMPVPVLRLSGL
jgi:hypothetical protein